MNAQDFTRLAIRLSAGDEASKRSAVSRGNYGVYHEVRQLLAACGVRFARGSTPHDVLGWCLQHSGDPDAAYAARLLKTLREARNSADYDLDNSDFQSQPYVNQQLKRAQEIQTVLAHLSPDAIQEQVRKYAAEVLKLRVGDGAG